MKNVCLITHIADADGAFPIILAKLIFDNLKVFSCEAREVDDTLNKVLEHQNDYDIIYIVDLNISEDMARKIDVGNNLKGKIKVFDHHYSNLHLNKYSFIMVVDELDNHKECGTTLFYQHLKSNYQQPILDKECLNTMVEFVREVDTYDFKSELKDESFRFGSLYGIYGRDKYIEHFYAYILENDYFEFSELDQILIELDENKVKKYIDEKMTHVHFAKIMDYKVGIVFAEKNRSLLGHEMAEKLNIDVAIIIDVDRSISYRACKEDIDASIIAKAYGGGGHKHACGNPIPLELHQEICKYIFKEIDWLNNEE